MKLSKRIEKYDRIEKVTEIDENIKDICNIQLSKLDIELLHSSMFADSSRYILHSVYFDKHNIVATNGHKLFIPNININISSKYIVPFEMFEILKRIFFKGNLTVIFTENFNYFKFNHKGKEYLLKSEYVDGVYVKYKNIYPDSKDFYGSFDLSSKYKEIKKAVSSLIGQSKKKRKDCLILIENKIITVDYDLNTLTIEHDAVIKKDFILTAETYDYLQLGHCGAYKSHLGWTMLQFGKSLIATYRKED